MKKKISIPAILVLLGTLLLFLFPVISGDLYLITVFSIALIYAVYAASWDLLSGFTGKENFGHGAYIAIGAYMLGLLSQRFAIQPYLSIPIAAVLSFIFGILIGLPTLRLKGPYFALATLAVATIMEKMTYSFSDFTGGEDGLYGIEFLTGDEISSFYFVLIFAVIAIFILYRIGKSNFGLTLKAIKSDDDAAKALGIYTDRFKVLAFGISATFAGIAGTISGHYYSYVGPDIVYPLSLTIIIMCVVGGLGGIIPAALGGFALSYLSEMLRDFGDWNQLIYSGILTLTVIFLPRGVFNIIGDLLKRSKNSPGGMISKEVKK